MMLTRLGLLVVLFEIIILQKNAGDILSISKLSNRIFGKLWLIVGTKCHGAEVETISLPFRSGFSTLTKSSSQYGGF